MNKKLHLNGLSKRSHVIDRAISPRGTFVLSLFHTAHGFRGQICHHPSLVGKDHHELTFSYSEHPGKGTPSVFGVVSKKGGVLDAFPAQEVKEVEEVWFEVLPGGYLWKLDEIPELEYYKKALIRLGNGDRPKFRDNSRFLKVDASLVGSKICFVGDLNRPGFGKPRGTFYDGKKIIKHKVVHPFAIKS